MITNLHQTETIANMEKWAIVASNNNYQVSNFGRVKRIVTVGRYAIGTILTPQITNKRQSRVILYMGGNRKVALISRLVGFAFVPNPHNKPQINHIDNNPLNNNYMNLEWATQKENLQHMFKQNRQGVKKKPVVRVSSTGERKTYESINSVASDGFNPREVVACAKNRDKAHNGFKWKYLP